MKTGKVLLILVSSLVVFFHTSTAHSCDSSALVAFLKYLDSLILEVLSLLAPPRPRHPGPIDCNQIFKEGHANSGIYRIWPLNWQFMGSFEVHCDMETDNGGWTVIQRRGNYSNPKDYFYKTWKEYKIGFGKLDKDFWLGNDRIFSLTDQGNYTLRIDMADKDGERRHAIYQIFWIENESQLYKLHLSEYSGDAGDSFSNLNGMRFTTKDMDNDIWTGNCAESFKGGWWYSNCHSANLNGFYHDGYYSSYADGVNWGHWKGSNYSLPAAEMKIRPAVL